MFDLNNSNEIRIISGEGAIGNVEIYNGKRTMRAIKMRLARECGVGRWSKAMVYLYQSKDDMPVWGNLITGEIC